MGNILSTLPGYHQQSDCQEGKTSTASTDASSQSTRVECWQHECEILEDGQESEDKWKNCSKYPGHENFVSILNFTEREQSRSFNSEQLDMLRKFADRVVRLRVKWTSSQRPEDYTMSIYRETDIVRVGTGFVYRVSRPMYNKACPCHHCRGNAVRTHWTLYVRTACHVIYNTEEARETEVDLFYDERSCKRDGRMKTVSGVSVKRSNRDFDESELLCVTHDEDLAERINTRDKNFWPTLQDRSLIYYPDKSGLLDSLDKFRPLKGFTHAVIVSHPHGYSKMVSVGKWNPQKGNSSTTSPFHYLTPTCSGSSGAPVLLIHTDLFDPDYFPWNGPVHGWTETTNKINRSNSSKHTYAII